MNSGQKDLVLGLVAKGDTQKALNLLLQESISDACRNLVIAISARNNRLWEGKRKGILNIEQQNVYENQIIDDILEVTELIHKGAYPMRSVLGQEVTIILDHNFNSFGDREKIAFLEALMQLLNLNSNVIIKRVEAGSVKITILVPFGKATELVEMISGKSLNGHRVIKVFQGRKGSPWAIWLHFFIVIALVLIGYFWRNSPSGSAMSREILSIHSSDRNLTPIPDAPMVLNRGLVVNIQPKINKGMVCLRIEKQNVCERFGNDGVAVFHNVSNHDSIDLDISNIKVFDESGLPYHLSAVRSETDTFGNHLIFVDLKNSPDWEVRGIVVDLISGHFLAGVHVVVENTGVLGSGYDKVSNDNGEFWFKSDQLIASDSLQIRAFMSGFEAFGPRTVSWRSKSEIIIEMKRK